MLNAKSKGKKPKTAAVNEQKAAIFVLCFYKKNQF